MIDRAVLVAYLGAIVGVSLVTARRARRADAFMTAGRSLAGWTVGLSIFGTFLSSISFLANPGKSYAGTWNAFVFGLSLPLAAWIAHRSFIPFYRRTGCVSAYAHLHDRFGPWARWYAVACYLLTQIGRIATNLYLVALAVSPMLGGADLVALIVVMGVLVTFYTLLGGIEAVIWTDVIQSLVLSLGIVLALGLLFAYVPGGLSHIVEVGWAESKFDLGSLSLSPWRAEEVGTGAGARTFWIVLIYGLVINLQNFGIDQTYVQRYAAAESDAAARRSVWLGAWLYLPVSAALFLLGTALYVYYQTVPAEGLPEKPDQVFPFFIQTELPVGFRGMLIAAILAAAMSSIDSSLNSSATLVLCDIAEHGRKGGLTENNRMKVLRAATVGFGAAGTLAGLAMIHVRTALDVWWQMAGIFGGGLLGLFLLGRLFPSVRSRAAIAGVAAGVVVILWTALWRPASPFWPILKHHETLAQLASPFDPLLAIVLGTATILAIGGLAGWLSRLGHRPGPL